MDIVLRAGARQQLLLPPRGRLTLRRRRPCAGIVAAGAEGKKLVQEVQRGIDRPRIGIGTEVAVAVVVKTTHAVDPGEILRQRHLDVRIALVVAHQHIILWPVLFNIIALQHQRLDLVLDDDKLDILDLRHHTSILGAEIGRLLEIRAHAVIQRDRLPDIQNGPLAILHNINARFMWQ